MHQEGEAVIQDVRSSTAFGQLQMVDVSRAPLFIRVPNNDNFFGAFVHELPSTAPGCNSPRSPVPQATVANSRTCLLLDEVLSSPSAGSVTTPLSSTERPINPGTRDVQTRIAFSAASRQRRAWVRKRRQQQPCFSRKRVSTFRGRVMRCALSALLLMVLLTIYLCLDLTNSLNKALDITLILLVLLSGILFVHSILRVCCLGGKKRHTHHHRCHQQRIRENFTGRHNPDVLPEDDSLYSPMTPLRVHLFRDEEALLDEKEPDDAMPCPPPPAYGLWRCSVRADPELLHWSRTSDDNNESLSSGVPTPRVSRPPSYNVDWDLTEIRRDCAHPTGERAVTDDSTLLGESSAAVQAATLQLQPR